MYCNNKQKTLFVVACSKLIFEVDENVGNGLLMAVTNVVQATTAFTSNHVAKGVAEKCP